MGSVFKASLILLSVVCLSACSSSKSDSQKAVDDANRSVEQAKKDADKAAEDAKKAANEAAEASKKANETALDATSSGGQPGTVTLVGALVVDSSNADSRIILDVQAGKGWRGQQVELGPSTVQLKQKLSDASVLELEKLKAEKTYVNLGCDLTNRSDLAGLEEQKIEAKVSAVSVIKAKIVLLCDAAQIAKNGMTLISADTVVLGSLQLEMVGAVDKSLSITTNELVVEADSSVLSKGKDGPSTILPGPSVSISAVAISGNGKIKIGSFGANYLAEQK
jgi:hypothetical protein